MSVRRPTRNDADAPAVPDSAVDRPLAGASGPIHRHLQGPQSLEEAEEQYVVARDAWAAAMKRASKTGSPADLASLAFIQEAYEAAAAEVERWRSGPRVAIPIEAPARPIDAIVGHELARRRAKEQQQAEKRPGLLGRIGRRLSGR